MKVSEDFARGFIYGEILATIHIYYYLPDYINVINEFIWQTLDKDPDFPRIHKFLDHWDQNVDADIQEAFIACDKGNFQTKYRSTVKYFI